MEFITSISLAYLNVSDYNVILIDWREAAKQSHLKAVKSVLFVAQRVAHLIDFLENNVDLDPVRTTVIGFSLGAHVASLSARFATSKIGEVVGKSNDKLSLVSYFDPRSKRILDLQLWILRDLFLSPKNQEKESINRTQF